MMLRLLDVILAGMVMEAMALLGWWRWQRTGVAPGDFAANLAAGLFLLLAMRLALGGDGWAAVAGCLGLALVFHVLELRQRWKK